MKDLQKTYKITDSEAALTVYNDGGSYVDIDLFDCDFDHKRGVCTQYRIPMNEFLLDSGGYEINRIANAICDGSEEIWQEVYDALRKYALAGNWLWVKGYLHQQGRDDLAEDVERYEARGASEGQYRELLDNVLPYRRLCASEAIAMGRAY